MAYYIVKYEGKHYINRELAKAHFHVGDAGLLVLVADGVLEQRKILDCCVYGEGPAATKKFPQPGKLDYAMYQNLDEQTASIVGDYAKDDESSGKVPYIVPAPNTTIYRLDQTEYMRMMDLYDPLKYRMFDKFPTVTFLGKKYIAINAASKDSDFIVRIKQ